MTGEQFPRFDLVLLGMGTDGHTASLFPDTEAIHEKSHLVVAPWVEKFHHYRITLTPPVLNHAAGVLFLVSGKEKAETLREVLQGDDLPDRFPAQVIRPTNGRLLWLVDQAAAHLLQRDRKGRILPLAVEGDVGNPALPGEIGSVILSRYDVLMVAVCRYALNCCSGTTGFCRVICPLRQQIIRERVSD